MVENKKKYRGIFDFLYFKNNWDITSSLFFLVKVYQINKTFTYV